MSARPFLITGLPRSRTAWMSVFCTTGDALCYHEPIAKLRDISELPALFQSEFYKHVGISDSTLGFFLDWILSHIQPRTLIIERDPQEVSASLLRLGLPDTNFVEMLSEKLAASKAHPLVMWVPFDALNSKRVMQKIFWHLMPGAAFDEERYEQLSKMEIEVRLDDAVQEAARGRPNLDSLLRDIIPLVKLKGKQDALLH